MLFFGVLALTVSGREFLEAKRRVSSASVKSELDGVLAEVLGQGHGVGDARLRKIRMGLEPLFRSLPKNGLGYVSAPVMRYAVRRYFSQNHGWFIKGFEPHAEKVNLTQSSGKDILVGKLPSMVRSTMEERFGHEGFSFDGVVAMIASVERLAFDEVVRSVEFGFKLNSFERTAALRTEELTQVLSTFVVLEMFQGRFDDLNLQLDPSVRYPHWDATLVFIKDTIGSDIFERQASASPFGDRTYGFEDAVRMAERISSEFGAWSHHECQEMKELLVEHDVHGTGRVRLSDFYSQKDGVWQFTEPSQQLREAGALDESSDFLGPQVMISNYLNSMSNCITSSPYYSICCLNECDTVFQQLEAHISGPTATVSEVIQATEGTYQSPNVSDVDMARLEDIARLHDDGKISVHGRLFAQWLHFVFPHECPYPHATGIVKPMTQAEWLSLVGVENENASEEEIAQHLESDFAHRPPSTDAGAAMWNLEESLLEISTPYDLAPHWSMWSLLRLAAQLGMLVCCVVLLIRMATPIFPGKTSNKPIEYDV